MKPTSKTRKPIDKITLSDLEVFPIWEFVTDEEGDPGVDETWIRPVKEQTLPLGVYSQLVACNFTTHLRKSFQGFMTVTTTENPFDINLGSIVTPNGYYFIPSRNDKDRKKFLKSFNLSQTAFFPLQYELRVRISDENQLRTGIIE